jgi:hypothetical protein
MRTARTITLVLLGGGVVLGGATMMSATSSTAPQDRQRQCEQARAQGRPDAEQICASARSATSHYHGVAPWFWARTAGAAARGPALADASGFRAPAGGASSRGGFGATARGFFSSGS